MLPKVNKTPIEHKDKLGRLIKLGDFVAYPAFNSLEFGKVMKLNNKMVGVYPITTKRYGNRNQNKYPQDIVLIEGPEVSMYLLKNSG
jgi:hypothetical protein